MNGNLLLWWMSRLGAGSWPRFLDAVEELGPDEDQDYLVRRLPRMLSDFGHVDFLRPSRKWAVRAPVIAELAGFPGTALLCGARSERLLSSLPDAAASAGCNLEVEPQEEFSGLPDRIRLSGGRDALVRFEAATGIAFLSLYSMRALAAIRPLVHELDDAQDERGVINWAVKTFDLSQLRWVRLTDRLQDRATLPPLTALELKSRFEVRKYCVVSRTGALKRLPKPAAVYAAASLQGRPLVHYDPAGQSLTVPLAAPMPESCSRIACICSGVAPRPDGDRLRYDGVPCPVATTLCVLLGQQHPGFF